MKYVAIIDSDDELSEESIEKIKDTLFVGNKAKYCFEIKSITKAPEPTTKNNLAVDCIDRVQAQTEIEMNACRYTLAQESGCMGNVEWSDYLIKVSDAVNSIRNLPSVTPITRWIPIVEGPPKERDWYLGIFKEPDTGWINPIPYICDYVGCKTEATTKEYWILKGYTDEDEHIDYMDYYYNLECVAWRPLPEPYKTESEIN